MTLGAADTGTKVRVGLFDRIAVRSDIANWRMPSPWPTALGIASAIMAWSVAAAFGNLVLTAILLAPSLVLLAWLAALMIRRAWCEHHPYLPPRWLAAARLTLGNDLVDAALARVSATPSRDPDRVLRRGEVIEAILDERHARIDARRAATGVRLSDAALRP